MEVTAVKSIVRRFIEALVLAAALLSPLIGRMARAGVLPTKATTCVEVANDGGCLIGATHVGLSLKMQGTEIAADMIDADSDGESMAEETAPETAPETARTISQETHEELSDEVGAIRPIHADPTVSLTSDLHQRVREGRLSADEALLIETELLARRDSFYYLPESFEQLKMDVGFAPDAILPVQDPVELVKVHVQLALSVSPSTASYLTERLGVRSRQIPMPQALGASPSTEETNAFTQAPTAPATLKQSQPESETNDRQNAPVPESAVPDAPLLRETASVAQSQS